jgi:hypothetical protein
MDLEVRELCVNGAGVSPVEQEMDDSWDFERYGDVSTVSSLRLPFSGV